MGLIIVDEKCVLFIHLFIHPIIISFKFLICDVAEVVIVLKVNYAKFGYFLIRYKSNRIRHPSIYWLPT